MVPVLVFFGVATLVGCLLRGIVWLRRRFVARQPDRSDGEVCQLGQANRITSVAASWQTS
jgi:predicted signal transduction protein with EAL and GGDEF domain